MIKIELDFPLPTWNRVLDMNKWERNKLAKLIHQLLSVYTQYEKDSVTLTVSPQKRLLMESSMRDYYLMIRPPTSKKSGPRKKRVVKRKR